MRVRRGFTLLEMVIAIALFSIVMAIVTNAFVSMRRSQGSAIANNILKVGGQRAIARMVSELSQARRLLASLDTDPATPDTGHDFFGLLQLPTTPLPISQLAFPRVNPVGGFGVAGNLAGQLDRAAVGNTLVFIQVAETIPLSTSGVLIQPGALPQALDPSVPGGHPYTISTYRFVAYYLVNEPLPPGAQPVGGQTTTLQLMRWQSMPYLEKGEFATLQGLLTVPATMEPLLAHDLVNNHSVVGLWDASAATAGAAIYSLDGSTGAITAMGAASTIQQELVGPAVQMGLDGYALPMVACNTNAVPLNGGLSVPTFTVLGAGNATTPYGFEVAMAGPSSARLVLVRLTLAARLFAGNTYAGEAHQDQATVFDM